MKNIEVYVYDDDGNAYQLDSEGLDLTQVEQLWTIEDLSKRKFSIKSLQVIGTKNNNQVFGHIWRLDKETVISDDTKLGWNYTPLRQVTMMVYENGTLLFQGLIRLTSYTKVGDNIKYELSVTSDSYNFLQKIKDKKLEDISFLDLSHRYNITSITESWNRRGYINNQLQDFQIGRGYLYPFIDYGHKFRLTGYSPINFNSKNFRPGIYVLEYLDRIFNQAGYTYEMRGDAIFQETINKLFVPDAQSKFLNKYDTLFIDGVQRQSFTVNYGAGSTIAVRYRLVPFFVVNTSINTIGSIIQTHGYDNVFEVEKSFRTNARITGKIQIIEDNINQATPKFVTVHLVKRPFEQNNNSNSGWTILAQQVLSFQQAQVPTILNFDFETGVFEANQDEQLAVRVFYENVGLTGNNNIRTNVYDFRIQFPATANQVVEVEVEPTANTFQIGDQITPQPPINIRQSEFIELLIKQFNLIPYEVKERPNHIIFEPYPSFYSQFQPLFIKNFAIDWSNKIDITNVEVRTNIDLPKNYLFKHKDDGDFLNQFYKSRWNNEIYGQLSFEDSLGTEDTKKIELLSSPTIVSQPSGTRRIYPFLYSVDNLTSLQKQLFKSNIRLMIYNGIVSCDTYIVTGERLNSRARTGIIPIRETILEPVNIGTLSVYPLCSNYLINTNNQDNPRLWDVKASLEFESPREYYFPATPNFVTASKVLNSYQLYYKEQTTDLTNSDVIYIECSAILNEIDVSSLDLRTPVFVSIGNTGGIYCRLLKVEFFGSDEPSKILLQRIGTI